MTRRRASRYLSSLQERQEFEVRDPAGAAGPVVQDLQTRLEMTRFPRNLDHLAGFGFPKFMLWSLFSSSRAVYTLPEHASVSHNDIRIPAGC